MLKLKIVDPKIPILFGNNDAMALNKMDLLFKSQKGVMSNDIFHLVVNESCDKGLMYAKTTPDC